jgi:hypothetical protein
MKNKRDRFVILLWFAIFVVGCTAQPQRNFTDQDLLFDDSIVPAGWEFVEANEVSPGVDEGQTSGAYKTYYNALIPYWARLGETVYRYAKVSQARWHYGRMQKEIFNDQAYYNTTPWQSPSEFTFSSQSANQWRFGCAGSAFIHENDVDCIYLAQYEEFTVMMTFANQVNGQESLSLEDIQRIVTHVDERVTEKMRDSTR